MASDAALLRSRIDELAWKYESLRSDTLARHKEAVQRIANAVRTANEAALKKQEAQFRKELNSMIKENKKRLHEEEEAYKREHRRLLDELKQTLQQQADDGRRANPETFRKEAQEALQALANSPLSYFRPGVHKTLEDLFSRARTAEADRLSQAACAMFSSCGIQAEIQRLAVQEEHRQWQHARSALQDVLQRLRCKEEELLSCSFQTVLGDLQPDQDTLDFYASGHLLPLLDGIHAMLEQAAALPVEVAPGTAPDAFPGTQELTKMISRSEQLLIRLEALSNVISAEIMQSAVRLNDGYAVLDAFHAHGYRVMRHGFRSGGDTTSAYICVGTMETDVDVTVCLLPHREYGLATCNHCVVAVTSQLTPADAATLTDLWRGRLSSCGLSCAVTAESAQQIPVVLASATPSDPESYIKRFSSYNYL